MTGTGAITVADLSVDLDGVMVLRNVNLRVADGEIVGLIGPNGAGKTTLLRALGGLVSHQGTITFGTDIGTHDSSVALMPQRPVIPQGMNVMEYVLLGRTAHLGWLARESGHDRDQAARVLRDLDLVPFAQRALTQLSGGERQRVVLARAMAQEPSILLLDEPTSALDIGYQHAVLELIDGLRDAHGLTIVAAMHDLTTAGRFADRLVLLDRGRVRSEGTPTEVLQAESLSEVYNTELMVRPIEDELVVLSAPPTRSRAM